MQHCFICKWFHRCLSMQPMGFRIQYNRLRAKWCHSFDSPSTFENRMTNSCYSSFSIYRADSTDIQRWRVNMTWKYILPARAINKVCFQADVVKARYCLINLKNVNGSLEVSNQGILKLFKYDEFNWNPGDMRFLIFH